MRPKLPHTPFSTPFSSSRRIVEKRIRGILAGPQKRPPLPLLSLVFALCFFSVNLVSCQPAQVPDIEAVDGSSLLTITPADTPLLWTVDLNHNGVPETLEVTWCEEMFYELTVTESGQGIYTEEAHTAHMGWNSVFLYQKDGEDFLLRYNPNMGQGYCTYSYQLFYLNPEGSKTLVQENSVSFDINFGDSGHERFVPEEIAAFMGEVNPLLADSVLLMNTNDDLAKSFDSNGTLIDGLWWLDHFPATFTRDESKSLLENLRDFQEAMILNAWYTHTVDLDIPGRKLSLYLWGRAIDTYGTVQYDRIEVVDREGDQVIQTITPEYPVENPENGMPEGLLHIVAGDSSYIVAPDPNYNFEGFFRLYPKSVQYVDLLDINFDGIPDFGIECSKGTNNRIYAWFVWDEASGQFRYLASLGWNDLRLDPEQKQVIEGMKDGPRHYDNVYEYDRQGNLTLVKTEN